MFEFTSLNAFYGHAAILRRFAGLSRALPLPFVVQHGWFGADVTARSAELHVAVAPIWTWSPEVAEQFRPFQADVFVGGSPFLYARSLLAAGVPKATGTLVFPPHSTTRTRLEFDVEAYLDELCALPREFQPLRACLHPASRGTATDRAFRCRGIETVTNGAPLDPQYLLRFIEHALESRYATAPQVSTALLYCAHLGLRVFVAGPDAHIHNVSDPHIPAGRWRTGTSRTAELASRLGLDRVEDVATQHAIATAALGTESMLSPAEIRRRVARHYRQIDPLRVARFGARKIAERLRRRSERAGVER